MFEIDELFFNKYFMQKLTIEISSKSWNFINSLEEIKTKLESWFISWFDENEQENYSFNIK